MPLPAAHRETAAPVAPLLERARTHDRGVTRAHAQIRSPRVRLRLHRYPIDDPANRMLSHAAEAVAQEASRKIKQERDQRAARQDELDEHGGSLYAKLPYDPLRDFTPVSVVASSPIAFMVWAKAPYGTLADLIAAGKAKPGEATYATGRVRRSDQKRAHQVEPHDQGSRRQDRVTGFTGPRDSNAGERQEERLQAFDGTGASQKIL